MTKTLITLCTFNERENIAELIPELHAVAPEATILIIDDNSPDGTGQLADQLSSTDPRVQVLHRAGKQGLGTATLAGFRYAIQNGFEFIVNLDADFSHHPKECREDEKGTDQHNRLLHELPSSNRPVARIAMINIAVVRPAPIAACDIATSGAWRI